MLRRLANLFGRGSDPAPAPSAFMAENPAYRAYAIGEGSYGYPTVLSWGEGATLIMGKYCSIAEGATIFLGGEHRIDWVTTYPFSEFWDAARPIRGHPRTRGNVTIGNDVWIGRNATLRSGVTIGDGAVVGAESVVTGNVAPYTIVAGNPARAIRPRFDPKTVDALLEIKWWDWPRQKIEAHLPQLLSSDLSAFIASAQTASH